MGDTDREAARGRAVDVQRLDRGGTGAEACDEAGAQTGDDTTGPDDWYPQLEERAPPIGSRRRLPRDLAMAIDGCLRPDPAARPTLAELATACDAALPWQRRHVQQA
ncbi:hypothetical protein [Streptomyces sp. NPDC001530]|uniref:hypothetical protein n=1 Tax=Streptomyces sp. NPDC001530 TaxID=3364582 RepID=UPI003694801D